MVRGYGAGAELMEGGLLFRVQAPRTTPNAIFKVGYRMIDEGAFLYRGTILGPPRAATLLALQDFTERCSAHFVGTERPLFHTRHPASEGVWS